MKRSFLFTTIIALMVSFFAFARDYGAEKADKKSNAESFKLRVIMSSDFPPIGVVKGGDDVPNTMKSDPDDMQSMVRFLLYANEFDIEALIASAGTFAMEAHKKNILGVLYQYQKVFKNLKKHDPNYPTADYLRSVTPSLFETMVFGLLGISGSGRVHDPLVLAPARTPVYLPEPPACFR